MQTIHKLFAFHIMSIMPRKKGSMAMKLIVAGAVLAGGGWFGWKYLRDYAYPEVLTTKIIEAPVVQAFYATGALSPDREYPIKANNPGLLTLVKVDKGDKVKQGDALVVVSEDAVVFKYRQAMAEFEQRKALAKDDSPILAEYDQRLKSLESLLEIAKRQETRQTEALSLRAAAQSDLDQAMDRVKTFVGEIEQVKSQKESRKIDLKKDLDVASAALEIAKWSLDRQTIASPIDNATVLNRPQSVGTRLGVNDMIMIVADVRPDQLLMRAQVDEEEITRVKVGGMVHMTLYAYGGRVFNGVVRKKYEKADPDRRTFEVDVEMSDKDPGFSPGMTGELAFIESEKTLARVIPSQAIQSGKVFGVVDGKLTPLNAKFGLRSIERTEVLEGIDPQTLVIISPVFDLNPGTRVRTKWMEPTEAANLNAPKKEEAFKGGF
jgi:HlyD family secretion protein